MREADLTAEYRRFVERRGLDRPGDRDRAAAILSQLDRLDGKVDRARDSARNAASALDVRRADRRIDSLEAQHAALLARLDEFAPELILDLVNTRPAY